MGGRLQGKSALVTAAGQGMGRAAVQAFAREGARMTATDLKPDLLAVREELGVEVLIGAALPSFRHDYPDFSVTLHPFRCTLASDGITLHEHKALRWMRPGELRTLDWAEADIRIIDHYCSQ